MKLKRIECGCYRTLDGAIQIEDRNSGKKPACWVAFRVGTPSVLLAQGEILRDAKRRLVKALSGCVSQ